MSTVTRSASDGWSPTSTGCTLTSTSSATRSPATAPASTRPTCSRSRTPPMTRVCGKTPSPRPSAHSEGATNVDRRPQPWTRTHPSQDASAGPVVDLPGADVHGLHGVRHLCHLARVRGRALLLRAVPLAVLLAVPDRRLRRGVLRLRQPVQLVAALAGADHPDLPVGLPDDLLLLPQGVLPVVLAQPAGVRGGRAARQVLR